MTLMRTRGPALLVAVFALHGCSYSYDVHAVMIDGRLAFVSADDDFTCAANISITTDEAARRTPAEGDNNSLIQNAGAFWWTNAPAIDWLMPFPVIYGTVPAGMRQHVAPKPLQIGTIYSVSTVGPGGGIGHGCFRLEASNTVRNLPVEHCHPTAPLEQQGNVSS